MAQHPLRPCKRCSVATRNTSGWCDKHQQHAHDYDKERGTAKQRGYGPRWKRYRRSYLARHPLCIECQGTGRAEPATVVHHKQPVSGAGDKGFWAAGNHEALCRDCHEERHGRKGQRE